MKVLLVTGAYPPAKCGVGDYTYHLAESLASLPEIEVGVLTSSNPCLPGVSSKVKVFRAIPNWNFRNTLQIQRVLTRFQPDVVHIQYPTQGYNGRLIKYLPLLFRILRLPVVQTWHEHFTECGVLGWQNLLSCKALIYVRPDLIQKLPKWVARRLVKTPTIYVPNASAIPVIKLDATRLQKIRQKLSGGIPIVCFFGFAQPNKGIERLFEIADPEKHHLVFICDLNSEYPYQKNILNQANQAPWAGKVTITGFQSAQRVGAILAAADAIIFPFPSGAGEWNTSLKAAEMSGTFTIATTQDITKFGYHEENNIYFAGCNQISTMKDALNRYLGTRKESAEVNCWEKIAKKHKQIYSEICEEK